MPQPRWLDAAWGDFGVAEIAGARDNTRVVRYYADVGHPQVDNDEVAWCAAFLGACLERSGFRSTRSLMARSYLGWGEPAADPRYGAIAVFSRGSDPRLGHVGFLVGETAADIILLGGNQGDTVSVQAFPRARLLGLRWPATILLHLSSRTAHQRRSGTQPRSPTCPVRARPRPRARNGGRLRRRPLRSRRPDQPGHHARRVRPRPRRRGHRRQPRRAQGRAEGHPAPPPCAASTATATGCRRPAPTCRPPLALFHFDAAVNQGVAGAARMLQQAVGAEVDGEIGPLTLAAVAAQPARADARRLRRNPPPALPRPRPLLALRQGLAAPRRCARSSAPGHRRQHRATPPPPPSPPPRNNRRNQPCPPQPVRLAPRRQPPTASGGAIP